MSRTFSPPPDILRACSQCHKNQEFALILKVKFFIYKNVKVLQSSCTSLTKFNNVGRNSINQEKTSFTRKKEKVGWSGKKYIKSCPLFVHHDYRKKKSE